MIGIRLASPDDAPALQSLATAAYAQYVPRIGRRPAPMTADYATTVAEGHAWVAEEDGHILGLLVLILARDHLLLENIAVHPGAQGRGIGATLLNFAEDHALACGLREIRLYTNQVMTENLGYYPRHGYVETHRAHQDGFQRVFFSKVLSPPG